MMLNLQELLHQAIDPKPERKALVFITHWTIERYWSLKENM